MVVLWLEVEEAAAEAVVVARLVVEVAAVHLVGEVEVALEAVVAQGVRAQAVLSVLVVEVEAEILVDSVV